MSDQPYSTLLGEALEAWEDARRGVLEEAEIIPDDSYRWRPTDKSRTVAEVLHHIL